MAPIADYNATDATVTYAHVHRIEAGDGLTVTTCGCSKTYAVVSCDSSNVVYIYPPKPKLPRPNNWRLISKRHSRKPAKLLHKLVYVQQLKHANPRLTYKQKRRNYLTRRSREVV